MEIRVTRHEPLGVTAVAVARVGEALPRDVRLVDDAVGAAVEELVLRRALDGVEALDLDDVLARAVARPTAS